VQAHMWANLAAVSNNEEAALRDNIAAEMTPAQIAKRTGLRESGGRQLRPSVGNVCCGEFPQSRFDDFTITSITRQTADFP
jgi:hypothetical protein